MVLTGQRAVIEMQNHKAGLGAALEAHSVGVGKRRCDDALLI